MIHDLATAEIYDPATGQFTTTPSMAQAHSSHSATLLKSGKVLVAGVQTLSNGARVITRASEVFDPTTGTWPMVGLLHVGHYSHAATLLSDGQVVLAGGTTANNSTYTLYANSAEIYDATLGAWRIVGSMTTPRSHFTLTTLPDGRAVALGGDNYLGSVASAEVYVPSNGAWVARARRQRGTRAQVTPRHCFQAARWYSLEATAARALTRSPSSTTRLQLPLAQARG